MENLLNISRVVFTRFLKYGYSQEGNKRKVVVISGCDSGLGYSLSLKCHQLGLTVISGCHNLDSEGAKALINRCYVYDLDVTSSKSVLYFLEKVRKITEDNEYEVHAVINNAGVMIFGEFEWYTERQIVQQVEVNMIGSFRMAKAFLPLLRKHKGRLINITSHCALANLPSLSVYGATKAAIQSWSDGLRLEQAKYGVKIINFIPGSFISQSNIMTAQESQSKDMENSFSEEDKEFYGKYFNDFNVYLRHVSGRRKPFAPLVDEKLYEKFTEALLHNNPRYMYKNEPWRQITAEDYLDCYQCSSSIQEDFPLCDDYYWHSLTDQKRDSLIVSCSSTVSDFCVKKEENVTGNRLTKRGCNNKSDIQGVEVSEGCTQFLDNDLDVRICFCLSNLCNLGTKLKVGNIIISSAVTKLLLQSLS